MPKWSPRACRGVYLGVSAAHSSNIPLVLTIKTGFITPQYHVVFDDYFLTVVAEAEEPQVLERLFTYNNKTWDQLNEDVDITESSRFERKKLEMKRKQMQTRNAQQSDRENGEECSLRHKSSESNSQLKKGSILPQQAALGVSPRR